MWHVFQNIFTKQFVVALEGDFPKPASAYKFSKSFDWKYQAEDYRDSCEREYTLFNNEKGE